MRVLIIFANEMKKVLTLAMLLVLAMTGMAQNKVKDMQTVYDFSLKDKKGNDVSLEQYKGKVLLIVNTATGCGFTPQYEDLEAMYHRLKDKGLEILDVPCNQFGHQAPGTDEEIKQFCTLKKPCQGGYEAKLAAVMEKLYNEANPEPRKKDDIQWNFTKFLISRDGQVIARFEPTVDMKEVEKQTEAAL